MALEFHFVLVLLLVYGTSYLFKFLENYDIPILLVEIIAGIVFGSVFGVVDESIAGWEFFTTLAAFGLLVIMFEAGLELDPEPVLERPKTVGFMAILTFLLPFLAGFGFGQVLGLNFFASFLIGVTLSTTSLGLVYPLLEDFGYLDTERGQLILAVTVLCDILSVVALAYGITLTSDNRVRGTIIVTGALLFFFIVVPVFLVDYIGRIIPESIKTNPVKFSIFFALALAFAFEYIGVHAILGAFFAGLIIAQSTEDRSGFDIEKNMKPVADLVTPVFFFYVGMQAAIPEVTPYNMLMLGGVLFIGIGSKIIGGVVGGMALGLEGQTTKLLASVMPGQLAMSVAAAAIGLNRGIIEPNLYNSLIVLAASSVFVSSILFRHFSERDRRQNGTTRIDDTPFETSRFEWAGSGSDRL
ncbi:monovalent cation:proton antiporter-2 (CPA2) family protein [Halolamina litorea]|uniref:Cation:proton antiporter n=1 Tax=Halolamina litorea TaxID=1515593 RepID=A0ABD6BRZ3_9EURY|nr:cation:proton antiporter [Halolamina litorea]